MKKLFDFAKNAVLEGGISATDLRTNKKQAAFKLAKTTAWFFIQNHPAYIAIKFGFYAFAALAVLVIGGICYFSF